MKDTALILIDIQNIYFTKGPYLLYEPEKAAGNAKKVLDAFREKDLPILHVKHAFGTNGYEEKEEVLNDIHSLVYPNPNEIIINKNYPNSFLHTSLKEHLEKHGIKNIVVVGMMTHMCVDTTVRECQNHNYKVTVLEDACTTMNLEWNSECIPANVVNHTFMAAINGAFANVVTTDAFLEKF